MDPEPELRDDPEVAPTAPQAPHEIRRAGVVDVEDRPVGQHHLRTDEVVARQPVAAGSTRFIGERSIMSPPSHTESPGMLWPPPRTATSRPDAVAIRTAAATSPAVRHRAMSAG
jgi:hypothetical protein